MKILIIIILAILLIHRIIKYFTMYCGLRGILYYLETEYDDAIDENKLKELTSMAVDRTIKEFFKQV